MASQISFKSSFTCTVVIFKKNNGEEITIGGIKKRTTGETVLEIWNQSPPLTSDEYLQIGNKMKEIEQQNDFKNLEILKMLANMYNQ